MKPLYIIPLFLALSCQGPWSYWPGDPENYQGIWIYAYIVSGRPVQNVCFDKMHALDEVRMPGFAFYESASVKITGTFSGRDTSFFLYPAGSYYSGYYYGVNIKRSPNCFMGPWDLVAEAGKSYELDASITWDSAGEIVSSSFHAETYIPEHFRIKRAYDLQGELYNLNYGAALLYLPPPMDLQSHYFIPEYSEDVSGVLVSMNYGNSVYWGENSFGNAIEPFIMEDGDTAWLYARFGDRNQVYFARNLEIGGMNKDIDSIPVMGMNFPASGSVMLMFYATTGDYVKFNDTYLQGAGDSRIKSVYNIQGGAGIFAGMLEYGIYLSFTYSPGEVKVYSYQDALDSYCWQMDIFEFGFQYHNYTRRRECIEYWDEMIRDEMGSYNDWYAFPEEELKRILSKRELATWCGFRDFPIEEYPLCGSAMVYLYNQNGDKSIVLAREAKKWCEAHKDDKYGAECAKGM